MIQENETRRHQVAMKMHLCIECAAKTVNPDTKVAWWKRGKKKNHLKDKGTKQEYGKWSFNLCVFDV